MNLHMYIIMYDCLAIAYNMYYMYSDIYSDSMVSCGIRTCDF